MDCKLYDDPFSRKIASNYVGESTSAVVRKPNYTPGKLGDQ